MSLLEIKNLKTYFHTRAGTTRAVDDVSFSIDKGEIVGVVGESGSGKSVTCHTMLGLLPSPPAKVEGGTVTFDGEELLHLPPAILRAIRGKRISMIFQDPMSCLNPYLTILDQVAEPILIHENVSREEAERRAIEMMKKVGIRDAEQRARSHPHEFSGGMRQRAMIAMALVTNPDLLLADEPTTALDVTVQARILQILRDLRDDLGVAVLFVTHDLGVVADVADRVVVMYRGKVVEQGDVLSIFENPSHPYVKGLLACRPTFETKYRVLPTVDDFLETEEAPDGSLTLRERPNSAERLAELEKQVDRKQPAEESSVPLLEVKDLRVHFTSGGGFLGKPRETVKAVDGVDLSIPKGKTLGLVGESGCGKTTIGRAILRLVPPTSGSVRYDGADLGSLSPAAMLAYRKRMQIIFQDPYASLNPRLTIEQALTEPLVVHRIGSGSSDRRDRVVSLLEEVGLSSEHLLRYPHEFSGGQRQRLCVARALAVEPEFIVCDECVSAMDVSVQAQVLNLLRELQERRNLTYLFISHDLSVVKFVSDHVAVMQAGRIVETAPAEELYRNPRETYTRELLEAVPKADLETLRSRGK
ncbi:MAG: ABC transporter ATP-binding protein [Verrucomicrobia bacterium]|jgi:peptide/nickel transport system ATP-binding protein|nr:ABC transporter ATP-binding protein [Verrucomicrobiota bacterium]